MRLLPFGIVIIAFLTGCFFGPLESNRLKELSARQAYLNLVSSYATHDEIYFFNDMEETLFLDALNLTPELLTASKLRWSKNPEFMEALDNWLPRGRGRAILLGIFSRSFQEDDFLKKKSFRAHLQTSGKTLAADVILMVKPSFLVHYFPVFNRWEKVFALHFPAAPGTLQSTLIVEWPAGKRELILKNTPVPTRENLNQS
ncbi:MAG: hypothetical protein LBF22_12160 [Deltaproteobacteria bacterium]|jgi:hypothetical protein|nr:hypothetical protein [Deltaproteobacteria bacterium]